MLNAGLGGGRASRLQTAIELQTVIDHALRGEAIARAIVSKFGISPPHGPIFTEQADALSKAFRIVGAEVKRGIAPDLAEAGNIVSNDGTAGECCLEGRHSQRLISGSGRKNRSATVKRSK